MKNKKEQYYQEIEELSPKIDKLKKELSILLKKRRQLKKNITLYEWRKNKKT
jgi:chorismate mutase